MIVRRPREFVPPALGAEPPKAAFTEPETSMPFANQGDIRSGRVYGRDTLHVQPSSARWYRVMWGRTLELPLSDTITAATARTTAGR